MGRSSESAAQFNREVAELAIRLADHDIVVSRLHADWALFGSWTLWLEAGPARDAYDKTVLRGQRHPTPGPQVLRFSWDGREGYLGIATAPTPRLEDPREWTGEPAHRFSGMDEALRYVEGRAIEHFGPQV